MEKGHLLNLREMVCGIGNQLRYVIRYATSRRHHHENVAEHQFFTAFFTLIIGLHLDYKDKFDIGTAVIRALIHDVEEHYTGDIIRPVKHKSKNVVQSINKTGYEFCLKFFTSITQYSSAAHKLFAQWEHAKDGTIEGRIVKFADFLSVISYLNQEIRSGNSLAMENVTELKQYVKMFHHKKFKFLYPLVNHAEQMVDDLYIRRK